MKIVVRARRRGWMARLLLFAVPAILIALHTLYWQWTRRALEDGWQAWAARRIAAGWRIEAEARVAGGWPLAVTLALAEPRAAAPDRSSWAGERLVLQVRLLHPDRLLVDGPGAQRLTLIGQPTIGFTAERLHLELPLAGSEAPAAFSLAATGISVPPSIGAPLAALGPSIDSLSATGRISEVADLPEAGIAATARQWRDRGGGIDIGSFALLWGPLDVSGSATLALDQRLQPKGDVAARVAGFAPAIARLTEAGSLPPQAAMLATATLAMLADNSGTAEVTLHLEGGRVTLRQIPLLTVPDLVWLPR